MALAGLTVRTPPRQRHDSLRECGNIGTVHLLSCPRPGSAALPRPRPRFLPLYSAEMMKYLTESRRPVILTVNGKAAAVVQDAEAYQHLLDLAAEANAAEGIRQGLEDLRNGRTRPAGGVFDEVRADHGISR